MKRTIFALALVLAGAASATALENKWRLQFSGNAESEGRLVISVADKGRPAVLINVNVPDNTSENEVATLASVALRDQIGARYGVEVDDGEDVLVKAHGGPKFNVSVVENTVRGVRVNLDQE